MTELYNTTTTTTTFLYTLAKNSVCGFGNDTVAEGYAEIMRQETSLLYTCRMRVAKFSRMYTYRLYYFWFCFVLCFPHNIDKIRRRGERRQFKFIYLLSLIVVSVVLYIKGWCGGLKIVFFARYCCARLSVLLAFDYVL